MDVSINCLTYVIWRHISSIDTIIVRQNMHSWLCISGNFMSERLCVSLHGVELACTRPEAAVQLRRCASQPANTASATDAELTPLVLTSTCADMGVLRISGYRGKLCVS